LIGLGSKRDASRLKTVEAQKHTFTKLANRYIRDVLPPRARPATQPSKRKQLEWWKQEIGSIVLADFIPALIAEARDMLVHQSSGSTANRYLAILSHAFTVAWREWG